MELKSEALQHLSVSEKDRGSDELKPVRNPDGRFLFEIDEKKKAIEHLQKGWLTRVEFQPDGTTNIMHSKVGTK